MPAFSEETLLAEETQQYIEKFGKPLGRLFDALDVFGLLLPFKTGHAKTDRWGTLKKKLGTFIFQAAFTELIRCSRSPAHAIV